MCAGWLDLRRLLALKAVIPMYLHALAASLPSRAVAAARQHQRPQPHYSQKANQSVWDINLSASAGAAVQYYYCI